MSDLFKDLAKILDENNMQVTFTGWKAELEKCEALLAQEKAAHEETKRSLAEVMSGCSDCHAFKSIARERDALKAALEKIADPRKREHKEPDAQTEVYCLMHIANEALGKGEKGG
jgi:hypothetical protein